MSFGEKVTEKIAERMRKREQAFSRDGGMRLETADGKYVARVSPLLPVTAESDDDVVLWGQRIFRKHSPGVWREITLFVVCTVGE